LAAALGTKWAHSVNVRLVLERQGTQRFIKVCARVACLCVHTRWCCLGLSMDASSRAQYSYT